MQYEPLDKTKNEIRILEFLDLSSSVFTEDIIQCSVRNVSLQSSLDSRPHQGDSQDREFPIAWDKFTKSVDLRDSILEHTTLDATTRARLHRSPTQCSGSRYDWGDFEALSYTWGNTGETKTIRMNGVRKNVSRNLEEALRALRNLEETLSGMCYWVDSLCIDQEDIEERNEQVKRMKEIYGRARAVIVWLGQEEEQDRIAVQMMHDICHNVKDRTLHRPADLPFSEWSALIDFAKKPYWNRCWIIQELIMNHNSTLFLCGEFKLTRKMIWSSADWSLHSQQPSEVSNPQFDHKLQIEARDMVGRMYDLLNVTPGVAIGIVPNSLLDLVRRADATDERDKIYSILGLLDPVISAGVTPDYSLSVQQVYTNLMKSVINALKRLDLIAFTGISAEEGWPSWVPDWRKPFQRRYIRYCILHQASGDIPAQFGYIEKEKDRTYLECSGFQVDIVDGIAAEPPLDSHATHSNTVSDVYSGQMFEAVLKTFCVGDDAISTESLFEVPWNLSRDTDDSLADVPRNAEQLELLQSSDFERWDKFRKRNKDFCIGGQKFRTFFAQSNEQGMKIEAILRSMHSALSFLDYRALITTRTGYIGLAPAEVQPGDVVAILFGCRWPVLLRPCDSGLYQFLGECYIHGFMKGEILDQQLGGHVLKREFILC